jgi:signal transduction histidine kinase
LTIAYAGVFVIGLLAILFASSGAAIWFLQRELKQDVEIELEDFEILYQRSGMAGIRDAMTLRAQADAGSGLSYHLLPSDHPLLADALARKDFRSGWLDYVPPGEDWDEPRIAKAMLVSDNTWLLVAVDSEMLHDIQEMVLNGTGWTLAIALPLALVCGWMMSALVLRRIEAITETTRRIREGGLASRVPVRGSGDEFDRLALNINAMLDSIEDLTRNLQGVTVGIAHDLRTPLSRVRNRLESLKIKAEPRTPLTDSVEGAIGEVSAVLSTFDALLRIGQIDAGTRRAGFRSVDLSGLVAELAETYEPVAAAAGKTQAAEIATGLVIDGDRELLTQMIANVLENAIEHTPGGTAIAVRLLPRDGAPVLMVADDGPGIPMGERGRVFERFYRLDRSRQTAGSGLGLSIVSAVAKLHGARITLSDNDPGLKVEIAFRRRSSFAPSS